MRLGVQIPEFTWPNGPPGLGADLARISTAVDEAGFHYLATVDHFFQAPVMGPSEDNMLEAYTLLGFLAAHTSRVRLLTLVTGTVYRPPGLLAKIVTTLDVLSGGRAWLGIGAAWHGEEAAGLGLPFPPAAERFERLEETLQICLRMWSGDERPFHGRHHRLDRPLNAPQSLTRPHPPILIGGTGPTRTLRLVARYADACSMWPDASLPQSLEVLRAHCEREGRDYDSIHKTCYYRFDPGPGGANVGRIIDDLGLLAEYGVQSAIGAVADVWRIDPLEVLAEKVVPAVAAF
ncbi:LLM class F420-dependent oxidoreductase [Micromonospora sp. LOL_024]|uniref:LLM class F420-dependent oxidoreductase n=1 Tax=Micromonospora sp. LOL_024 TaxID=3345412 RepID=UPI003A87E904